MGQNQRKKEEFYCYIYICHLKKVYSICGTCIQHTYDKARKAQIF